MHITQDIVIEVPTNMTMLNPFSAISSPLPPMPLDQSDAHLDLSDPNIVLGPCKRRPTKHLLENGDLLSQKKVRKVSAAVVVSNALADTENHTSSSLVPPPVPLTLIVAPSACPTPVSHPTLATQPRKMCTTDSAKSSNDDDGTSNGAQVIVVEDDDEGGDEREETDEDDDAKLCM